MMTLAETIPKLPEILFMTRRKKYSGVTEVYDPKTKKVTEVEQHIPSQVAIKRRYYLKQQPPEPERWTHLQFQRWVKAMGYPLRPEGAPYDTFPYEPKPIAQDLGIRTNRVYVYWRGYDKDAKVPCDIPATTTLLCKALLELKKLGKKPK